MVFNIIKYTPEISFIVASNNQKIINHMSNNWLTTIFFSLFRSNGFTMVGVENDMNDIMLRINFHTGKFSSENVRIKVKKYLHLSRKNPVVHKHTKEKEINRVSVFVRCVGSKEIFFFAQFMSASINDVAII